MSRLERSALIAASLSVFLLAACSAGAVSTPSADATAPSADASASATDAPVDGPITALLRDRSIKLSSVSAPAGEVTFEVENVGVLPHEIVLIRTDLDAADLPTDDVLLKVIEDDLDIVDKVQDLQAGESASLTVNLEAGHYVVICNVSAHYDGGGTGRSAMRVNFDVS